MSPTLLLLLIVSMTSCLSAAIAFVYQNRKITQQALTIALHEQTIDRQNNQQIEHQTHSATLNQTISTLQAQLNQSSSEQARLEQAIVEKHQQWEHSQNLQTQQAHTVHTLEQEKAQLTANIHVETERLAAQHVAFKQLKEDFTQQQAQMENAFTTLSERILGERQHALTQENNHRLEALLKPLGERIEHFEKRINTVHTETLKGQGTLEAELKNIIGLGVRMNDEANNLAQALKGSAKIRGNWGEVQLERTLEVSGLMPETHYQKQASLKTFDGKRQQPDFLLRLPQEKQIIIDSKVSLVAYEQWVSANNPEEQALQIKAHVLAVKQHIKELANKEYSQLPGLNSPNFVLMFMPIEPAYIAALQQDATLFEYGYQRNVVLVSHTTLAPILRTVANLWMLEQGQQEAKTISEQAGAIYNTLCTLMERFQKLGNTLQTASTQYNDTVTAFTGRQGLQGKVERFKQLSSKANKTMPTLEAQSMDYQTDTLVCSPGGDSVP